MSRFMCTISFKQKKKLLLKIFNFGNFYTFWSLPNANEANVGNQSFNLFIVLDPLCLIMNLLERATVG